MRYYILLILLTISVSSIAQTITTDTVITQIITFESTSNNPIHNKLTYKKNSVGMSLLSWVQGYLPVYYERNLLPFLSIKAGVGITFRSFTNDLGQVIWNDGKRSEFFDSYNGPYQDVKDSYEHYTYRLGGVGYYFAFAPKFYVHSEGMNGFTVSPMIEFKHFASKAKTARTDIDVTNNYAYTDNDLPRTPVGFQKETLNCIDFTVNIGGHYQTSKVFFIEWRLGAGVRKSYANRLDVGINTLTDRYQNEARRYQSVKPFFATDIILGGLF